MLNCHQTTQILSEKMDRPLSMKEKMSVFMHTSMCSACRNFEKQMGEIRHLSKEFLKQDFVDDKENRK
ncbi:zf-HC2 domain-containing protein [Acinetobacter portensis]|uniref:zf-HC2 domain-containing protein n=1 Tax=Acinetobacter portensis TaxID=1839785 RepID=UPI003D7C44CD